MKLGKPVKVCSRPLCNFSLTGELSMRIHILIIPVFSIDCTTVAQQPVTTNKHFSFGTYGRVGIARGDSVLYPRSLNLNGMGSIGGRMEEADYLELATAFHFKPVNGNSDTTDINVQARLAFYTTQGQLIGNVTSKSTQR